MRYYALRCDVFLPSLTPPAQARTTVNDGFTCDGQVCDGVTCDGLACDGVTCDV